MKKEINKTTKVQEKIQNNQPDNPYFNEKKILPALITLFFSILIFFIVIKSTPGPTIMLKSILPTPTPPGHTTLSLSLNSNSTQTEKILNVTLETDIDKITALQIGLDYDPDIVKNVQIKPGTFFTNPVELRNKNNEKLGKYIYALGIQPSEQGIIGTGNAMTISYQIKNTQKSEALFLLIPQDTLVTASGISRSVIKKAVSIDVSTTSNQTYPYIPLVNY